MKLNLIFNNSFFKVVLVIYLLLKPFLFFDNGSPQISDYVLIPTLLLYFGIFRPTDLLKEKPVQFLVAFLTIVFVVNVGYATLPFETYQWEFLVPFFYYGYNALLFIFCSCLFKTFTKKDFTVFLFVIFISLGIQFLLILLDIDKGVVNNFKGRDYNYFNNPNQLAYYSLLLLTFLFFVRKQVLQLPYLVTLCVSLALVSIVCATSFPALLGGLFLLVLYILILLKRDFYKHLLVLLIAPLLLVVIKHDTIATEYNRIANRFDSPTQRVENSYADRGYDRVFVYPHYLLYGAGEGMYERFVPKSEKRPQEIHNTIINIFFNYGVLGGIMFVLFLYHSFKLTMISQLVYLFPIIVYNLLHNGIRYSLIWVIIAYIHYASQAHK